MKKNHYLILLLMCCAQLIMAQPYELKQNIPYVSASETDAYRLERCKLDLYYPTDKKAFPTIVWFHGGGLEGGNKEIPEILQKQGFAVVGVNYRLSPRAKNPAYTTDAAEAVAWVFHNIEQLGGDKRRIYVSGHSAGGYLTLMLAMDKSYLAAYGVDADSVAAYLPVSGQTVTHYTIRKERGLPDGIPIIDTYAPVNHARKDTPPVLLISGDKQLEMAARYEENALLAAVLKSLGNKQVELFELQGFDHGQVFSPACHLIVNYIKRKERRR
jgi:acetyl esterase/lipase